jgi:hypothetical protein
MKNMEKGAVTISKSPSSRPRVFAIFLQPKFPSCRKPTKLAELSLGRAITNQPLSCNIVKLLLTYCKSRRAQKCMALR